MNFLVSANSVVPLEMIFSLIWVIFSVVVTIVLSFWNTYTTQKKIFIYPHEQAELAGIGREERFIQRLAN